MALPSARRSERFHYPPAVFSCRGAGRAPSEQPRLAATLSLSSRVYLHSHRHRCGIGIADTVSISVPRRRARFLSLMATRFSAECCDARSLVRVIRICKFRRTHTLALCVLVAPAFFAIPGGVCLYLDERINMFVCSPRPMAGR